MKYLNSKEISILWDINERRVRLLCEEGRIEGAQKIGRNWAIPENSNKPTDARFKSKNRFSGLDAKFIEIDKLNNIINSKRPFDKNTIKMLNEKLLIEWTYHSNSIEGNTLTMSETKVVLEGITIGGKSVKEHLEVLNHKNAILYFEDIINNNIELSERIIKDIHSLILKDIDNKNAGKYRLSNVIIGGAEHIPSKYFLLNDLMGEMIKDYYKDWNKYHPIVKACLLHGEFVKIHPFVDGNGRTARILLNFELMKNGYPPIVIKNTIRAKYYDALDYAHITQDYSKFIKLIESCLIESIDMWLSILD